MTCITPIDKDLCILKLTARSRRCDMKPNKFRQPANDQLIGQGEDRIADLDIDETALERASNDQLISDVEGEIMSDGRHEFDPCEDSADYYERMWNSRIKLQQGDIWIAVALYLTVLSVAFVVL